MCCLQSLAILYQAYAYRSTRKMMSAKHPHADAISYLQTLTNVLSFKSCNLLADPFYAGS